MKIISSLLLLFFSFSLRAENKSMSLKTDQGTLVLYEKNNIWVSQDCLSKVCSALKKPKPVKIVSTEGKWAVQPAADFCVRSGGTYIIGVHPKGDQDGVCRFNDKSFILGWDYFKRNGEGK